MLSPGGCCIAAAGSPPALLGFPWFADTCDSFLSRPSARDGGSCTGRGPESRLAAIWGPLQGIPVGTPCLFPCCPARAAGPLCDQASPPAQAAREIGPGHPAAAAALRALGRGSGLECDEAGAFARRARQPRVTLATRAPTVGTGHRGRLHVHRLVPLADGAVGQLRQDLVRIPAGAVAEGTLAGLDAFTGLPASGRFSSRGGCHDSLPISQVRAASGQQPRGPVPEALVLTAPVHTSDDRAERAADGPGHCPERATKLPRALPLLGAGLAAGGLGLRLGPVGPCPCRRVRGRGGAAASAVSADGAEDILPAGGPFP